MGMFMKIACILLGILPSFSSALPAGRNAIPPELLAGRTCQEHILKDAQMTAKDWPSAAKGRGEFNAVVIVSYKLDGSGKAIDPKVVYSTPKKIFDRTTVNLLGRIQFASSAVEESCYYLHTYSVRRRR
jgi:TonB family protein